MNHEYYNLLVNKNISFFFFLFFFLFPPGLSFSSEKAVNLRDYVSGVGSCEDVVFVVSPRLLCFI